MIVTGVCTYIQRVPLGWGRVNPWQAQRGELLRLLAW